MICVILNDTHIKRSQTHNKHTIRSTQKLICDFEHKYAHSDAWSMPISWVVDDNLNIRINDEQRSNRLRHEKQL